jgi:putative flippase GtrA
MVARQFLLFSVVGGIGFLVDVATLYLAIGALGAGLYGGRLISYVTAATVTWLLNRRYTFRDRRSDKRLAEWGRFLAANATGGLVNYATYAYLVTVYTIAATYPVLGVAAGSVVGLTVNFCLSRYLVFRGRDSSN